MTARDKKMVFRAGILLAVAVLVLVGTISHGVHLISEMPVFVRGSSGTGTVSIPYISYSDDHGRLVSEEDVREVRNKLCMTRVAIGWYDPGQIDFDSPTNGDAFFTRRATTLAMVLAKENNVWVIKREVKDTSSYGRAADAWDRTLDEVSKNLP